MRLTRVQALLLVPMLLALLIVSPEGFSVPQPYKEVSDFDDANAALEYFLKRRVENRRGVPTGELANRFGAETIVKLLENRPSSDADLERISALRTLIYTATESGSSDLRQRAVEHILSNTLAESGNRGDLAQLPSSLRSSDYSAESKRLLMKELSELHNSPGRGVHEHAILKAVGRAGMAEAIPILREIDARQQDLPSPDSAPLSRRSALLAMARLGEGGAVEEVISLTDGVEDLEERSIHLGRLSYVWQPEVVAYLKKFLFSDAVYPSRSRDVLDEKEATRAASALGAMLADFPSKGTIEEQRAWMTSQTFYRFKGEQSNSDDDQSANDKASTTREEPLLNASDSGRIVGQGQAGLETENAEVSNGGMDSLEGEEGSSVESQSATDGTVTIDGEIGFRAANDNSGDKGVGASLTKKVVIGALFLVVGGVLYLRVGKRAYPVKK